MSIGEIDGSYDTWTDFTIDKKDGDQIDISSLLIDFDTSESNILDCIELRQDGKNTVLAVDRDGKGGSHDFVDVLNIGVQSTDLTLQQLLDNNQILF